MQFRELANLIESHEFAARVSVASDLQSLISQIAQEDAVQRLVELFKEAPSSSHDVLHRIYEISWTEIDLGYANPKDAALAAYLFVLRRGRQGLAQQGAEVVTSISNTFWAARVASSVLTASDSRSAVNHEVTDWVYPQYGIASSALITRQESNWTLTCQRPPHDVSHVCNLQVNVGEVHQANIRLPQRAHEVLISSKTSLRTTAINIENSGRLAEQGVE